MLLNKFTCLKRSSIIIYLRFWISLIFEVIWIIFFCMILEFRVADIVSPTHHLRILASTVDRWEHHLKIISFWVERIICCRSPLHQGTFKCALCIKINYPILSNFFVSWMIMNMFLLRHVDVCDLVLVFGKS